MMKNENKKYDNKQHKHRSTSSSAPRDAGAGLSRLPGCGRDGQVASTQWIYRQSSSPGRESGRCYLGWQESLTLLAKLVEAEIPDQQ